MSHSGAQFLFAARPLRSSYEDCWLLSFSSISKLTWGAAALTETQPSHVTAKFQIVFGATYRKKSSHLAEPGGQKLSLFKP